MGSKIRYEELKRRVYKIVSKVPKGRVTTYKDIAKLLGIKSYRLIGKILSENNDPFVPCHRVVGARGFLVGYNKGIEEKARKLEMEGVRVSKGKVVNFNKYRLSFKELTLLNEK